LPASLQLATQGPNLMSWRDFIPSLRLVTCGAGPEAEWLSTLAKGLGVAAVVVGPDSGLHLNQSPDWLELDRWTAVTLLYHNHEWERAILEWALASAAFHIGAMSGRKARENRHAMLIALGAGEDQIARMRSPIGLIKQTGQDRLLVLSVLSEIAKDYDRLRSC
jgi:xanthine dehydrogenase accessory factor